MSFKFIFFLHFLFIFISPLHSEEVPTSWSNWEEEYQSYCVKNGKGQFCDNLKNIDGSWVTPSESVKKLLVELYPQIEKASKAYNVKKESIIAAILAENSLNVSLNDEIQNWLVKNKIFSSAKVPLLGYFSIGFSQVTVSAALKVEETSAKAEGRKVRSEEEIAKELLNPVGAIYYTAAIIKYNQDIYSRYGFDISNQPDLIASLHSLGAPEKYAAKAKSEGRQPRPNFMGIFASKYHGDILTLAKVKKVEPEKKSSATTDKTIKEKQPEIKTPDKNQTPLLTSIPLCKKNGAGMAGDYKKNLTYFEGVSAASMNVQDPYYKVAESVDCNLQNWTLVRTSSGSEGWIKNEKLLPKHMLSLKIAKNKDGQTCSAQNKCLAEIKKINGDILSSKGKNLELKVAYLSDYGEPDISKYDADACIAGWGRMATSKQDKGNINQVSVNEFSEIIKTFVRNVNSQYNLENNEDALNSLDNVQWDKSTNPFLILHLNALTSAIKDAKKCADAKIECRYDFKLIENMLTAVNVENPKLDEILRLASTINYSQGVVKLDSLSLPQVKLPRDVKSNIDFFLSSCNIDPRYIKSQKMISKITQFEKKYTGQVLDYHLSDKNFWKEKIDTCNYINFLDKKIQSMEETSIYCKSTQVNVLLTLETGFGGSSTNTSNIDISLLNKLLSNESSKDEYLSTALGGGVNFDMNSLQEFPTDFNCSYDPFKTSEMIKNLSSLKCIERVYISDLWVLKKLSKEVSNLYYLPSASSRNFEVLLKNECK